MKKRICALLGILLLLAALLAVPVGAAEVDPAQVRIPDGATIQDGHAYLVYTQQLTYGKAYSACRDVGGHLATITSQEEQNVVNGLVRAVDKAAWLGGTSTDKKYHWNTDEPFKYTNWYYDEPSHSFWGEKQDCIAIYSFSRYNGEWFDVAQDDKAIGAYVCEWDNVCQAADGNYAGHKWNFDSVITPATCVDPGTNDEACVRCPEHRTVEVPALEHRYGDLQVTSGSALIPPIVREHACTVCQYAESFTDWSLVWVPILAVLALVGAVIGVWSYVKAFKRN